MGKMKDASIPDESEYVEDQQRVLRAKWKPRKKGGLKIKWKSKKNKRDV